MIPLLVLLLLSMMLPMMLPMLMLMLTLRRMRETATMMMAVVVELLFEISTKKLEQKETFRLLLQRKVQIIMIFYSHTTAD